MNSILRHATVSTGFKLVTALLLCALGDFLLYDRSAGALAWAIYGLVLLFAITWHNLPRLDNTPAIVATALLAGQAAALILGNSTLPYWWLVAGLAVLCAMACGIYRAQALQWALLSLLMAVQALVLPFQSFATWQRVRARRKGSTDYALLLRNWLLPLAAGLVFLALFSGANPVFDRLTAWLNLDSLFGFIKEPERIFLWCGLFVMAWMLVRPRLPLLMRPKPRAALFTRNRWVAWIFSPAAILRALVLCNAIFAVQGFSDIAYLWGGMELPAGISHARYAQQGAYSLLIAALLAAGFVLLALREGSDAARHAPTRWLIYSWIGQNLLLLMAAAQRLSLYVEAYSLTYMRLAAFIWMGVVAMGLLLIIARILLRRPGGWLVAANGAMLLSVLYLCSFANFGGFIAQYNVSHSRELGGEHPLDLWYLQHTVGRAALPALRRYEEQGQMQGDMRKRAQEAIRNMEMLAEHRQRRWRSWTLRDYWLARGGASGYGEPTHTERRP